jgi:NADH-quinone oxidoreductase subunit E
LQDVTGEPGDLSVSLNQHPRYVNPEKCTGCGVCLDACPIRYEVQLPPEEEAAARTAYADAVEEAAVAEIIHRHREERGNLLPILLDINRHFNWLPRPALEYVAGDLGLPLAEILRVATFYNAFSLVPRGKHIINICLGTSCFVNGSPRLLEEVERKLGLKHGETSADMLFTLEVVRCIGCCALAPAVRIGEATFGRVTPGQISKIIDSYTTQAANL